MRQPPPGDSTRVLHAGLPPLRPGQPFLPGPVFAAPFVLDPVTGGDGIDWYGRPHNASRRHLETAIGELEGGECLTFATGMTAIGATLLSLLYPGDTVILPADGYFTTRAFGRAELQPRGITVVTVPTVGPYPSFDGVKLVLVETPANPGLDVCDLAELAAAAHAAGALLAVDNTTATPLGQRPLELGADLVVASGTKALTGHSDLLLGYVATGDADLFARLRSWRDSTGGAPSAFDSWLAHRSLATLDLRLGRQSVNAAAIADVLAAHPAVTWVRWPGRPEDPSYRIAAKQMARIPGVVTFDLGDEAAVARFLTATELVIPATSFGGLHTTADRRAQWGDDAPPGLVRLSCGVEDTVDLVADITRALDAV